MHYKTLSFIFIILCISTTVTSAQSFEDSVYEAAEYTPTDSTLRVAQGEEAPDFTLPAVSGDTISLSDYRGKHNVMLSFVPSAWTPICSDQWPGYNIAHDYFEQYNTHIIGITVDNVPTLYAWTKAMGDLWFPVLSDFYPHGAVASEYGILRSNGVSERALFLIDMDGIIRYIDVHDINKRPPLDTLVEEMEKL